MAIVAAAVLLCCVGACKHGGEKTTAGSGTQESALTPLDRGVVVLSPGGRTVRVAVEVARTDTQVQRGLMFRKALGDTAGMLFIFERDREHSFWMKNTYVALDMIFIDKDLSVIGVVHNAEPMTTVSRTVGKPSRYVLEVNATFAKKHGIDAGTKVAFEGIALHKK
ncbi:MAG: DUF192 domain-containing protein [Myxococcales bacterium]|nr:DUF192 domain-containing protein [Myxococcales bacterium]